MAKQRQSGIVGAAQNVSESQGNFINQGGRFVVGYNKGLETKRKKEEANKAIQERANKLMDGFTNDIDVLKFKPEDQTLVKNKVVGWRNEYADAANAASKLEDKTGAEYQAYMDTMNDVKARMSNLSNNINNLAATKGEYGKNIQARHYSSAGSNDMALHQGLIMVEYPIGSIDDTGNLMWSDESAGDFNMQDYQLPFEKANGVATQLDNIAAPLTKQKGPLSPFQKERIIEQVEDLVASNPDVLQSFISDKDLTQFKFKDVDPEDPNASDIVVERLTKAMFDTRGSGLEEKDSENNNNTSGKNKGRNSPIYTSMEDLEKKYFNTPALNRALRFTADERVFTLGSKNTEVTLKNDGWYLQSKQPDGTVFYNKYTDVSDLLERNSNLFN